jgi:hypothetical protein
MQIKESYVGAIIAIIGWVASGIWMMSNMSSQMDGLKQDVARVERQCENLNDRMYWYAAGNTGPVQPKGQGE